MGLMSVAAVRLFQLKGEARTAPERPAEQVIPPKYAIALRAVRKLGSAIRLTVGRFFRELAKLGGFLGRRRDGEPGWITIWRGWDKLQTMIRGVGGWAPWISGRRAKNMTAQGNALGALGDENALVELACTARRSRRIFPVPARGLRILDIGPKGQKHGSPGRRPGEPESVQKTLP